MVSYVKNESEVHGVNFLTDTWISSYHCLSQLAAPSLSVFRQPLNTFPFHRSYPDLPTHLTLYRS